MNPQAGLTVPNDLALLGPKLLQELNEFFPFKTSRILPLEPEEALESFAVSARQKVRALNALSRQKAFWDRVGEQVMIPVIEEDAYQGLIVLHDPGFPALPDEAERWLPLLKDWIEQGIKRLKKEAMSAPAGSPPRMLDEMLAHPLLPELGFTSLLYVRLSGRKDAFKNENLIRPATVKAFGNAFFLGGNFKELWYLITFPEDLEQGAAALHNFFTLSKAKGLGPKKILVAGLSWQDDKPGGQKETFRQLERISTLFDADIFTSQALTSLEKMLDIDSLLRFLEQCIKAQNGSRRHDLICYASPLTRPMLKRLSQSSDIRVVRSSNHSALILTSLSEEPIDVQTERLRKFIVGKSRKKVTIGIYYKNKKSPALSKGPVGALWAYRHAELLGKGKTAVFDDVTLNVAGDEMFSWGDLPGSLRHYRRGVKLGPGNGNLWNSLGVCLAQMRRKKDAIKAFQRAARLEPGSFMAFYNLGCAYMAADQMDKARKSLKQALAIEPGNLAAATRLSAILLKRSRYRDVIKLMEPLTAEPEKVPVESLQMAAEAFWRLGQWKKSRGLWHKILSIQPRNKKALAYLALCYAQKAKDLDTARRLFQQIRIEDCEHLLSKEECCTLGRTLG